MIDPTTFRSVLVLFLGLIALEVLWSTLKHRQLYHGKETAANLGLFVGMQLTKLVSGGWAVAVLSVAEPLRLWNLPSTLWTTLVALVVVDFFYYWQHRTLHQVKFFWAMHEVHHSSPWYNLTTSFRLNWVSPFFSPLFFLPAVLLGFQVEQVMVFLILNLFYQFWLHTRTIPALGPLEGILNTPSAHRVHHGSNPYCIDKNFGGILMIWDRLFGTYAPETEPVVYGVTTGFKGHNPFKLVFLPLWKVLRGQQELEQTGKPVRSGIQGR